VNLVKSIESLVDVTVDQKKLRSLKRQLKTNSSDINRLRQSTINPAQMLAPIHAAILYGNFEIVRLVLDTEGVDLDIKARIKSRSNVMNLGIIDVAVCFVETIDIEVVKYLLERNAILELHYDEKPIPGTPLSVSLMFCVQAEHLDVLDVLHSKAGEVEFFSPFYSLLVAIVLNKERVFKHVLPQVKAKLHQKFYDDKERRYFTLLEFAELYKRTEMCDQIKAEAAEYSTEEKDNLTEEKKRAIENTICLPCDLIKNATKSDDEKNHLKNEKEIAVHKSDEEKCCWKCLRSAKNVFLYKCAGCRKARYCDDECQEEDWGRHGKYCTTKMNKRAFKEFRSISLSVFS